MSRRALSDRRPFLLLSLLFATSYYFVMDGKVGGSWLSLWKGAGVGFLALYALYRGSSRDGLLLAIVMTLCAVADVALEFSFAIGGALFAMAHIVAIALYWSNMRANLARSQIALATALIILTPVIAGFLAYPQPNWWWATGYIALAGAMAATAWTSRFPRYRTGLGAVLFVASDLLIVASASGQLATDTADWVIWPLYYTGQLLIVLGVIRSINPARRDVPSKV